MWLICYASNAALRCFEDLSEARMLPPDYKRLMNSLLSSRLLSGGLPYTHFESMFTPQFNAHYNILVTLRVTW